MKAPTVKRPSVSQPPQVSWLGPEDRDATPNVWVIQVMVQQLINAVWRRIPEPAREIIALDLQEVLISDDYGKLQMVYEENQLLLGFDSRELSPQWELSVMWLLAEGLGIAFVYSMVARMAGGNTLGASLPETAPATPVSAWYRSLTVCIGEPNAYKEMTWQMASALVL